MSDEAGGDEERFVFVDYRDLSKEALRGLIEEFVTRQGTDYGLVEASSERKLEDVMGQLERGDARIVYDVEDERANIVHRAEVTAKKKARPPENG